MYRPLFVEWTSLCGVLSTTLSSCLFLRLSLASNVAFSFRVFRTWSASERLALREVPCKWSNTKLYNTIHTYNYTHAYTPTYTHAHTHTNTHTSENDSFIFIKNI